MGASARALSPAGVEEHVAKSNGRKAARGAMRTMFMVLGFRVANIPAVVTGVVLLLLHPTCRP